MSNDSYYNCFPTEDLNKKDTEFINESMFNNNINTKNKVNSGNLEEFDGYQSIPLQYNPHEKTKSKAYVPHLLLEEKNEIQDLYFYYIIITTASEATRTTNCCSLTRKTKKQLNVTVDMIISLCLTIKY